MIKNVVWATLFIAAAGILQSALLSKVAIYHAVPDLTLAILVYTSYEHGIMCGQLTGFFGGIALDFLSAAPLGMNTFIRTIIGAAGGLLKGNFVLDSVFLPMLLTGAATLFKALMLLVLSALFAGVIPSYSFSTPKLWVELAMNIVSAPFIFLLLRMFTRLIQKRSKGLVIR